MGDDAYARRNRRKKAKGSACVLLVALAGSLISLGWFLNSAAGWVL